MSPRLRGFFKSMEGGGNWTAERLSLKSLELEGKRRKSLDFDLNCWTCLWLILSTLNAVCLGFCYCRELTWSRRFVWRNPQVPSWSFCQMQTLCLSRWFWRRMAARMCSRRWWRTQDGLREMGGCLWKGGSLLRSLMDVGCAAWTCAKVSSSFYYYLMSFLFFSFLVIFVLSSSSTFSSSTCSLLSAGQDLARYLEGKQFDRKIYIGDSKNDHCPSTRLSKYPLPLPSAFLLYDIHLYV